MTNHSPSKTAKLLKDPKLDEAIEVILEKLSHITEDIDKWGSANLVNNQGKNSTSVKVRQALKRMIWVSRDYLFEHLQALEKTDEKCQSFVFAKMSEPVFVLPKST